MCLWSLLQIVTCQPEFACTSARMRRACGVDVRCTNVAAQTQCMMCTVVSDSHPLAIALRGSFSDSIQTCVHVVWCPFNVRPRPAPLCSSRRVKTNTIAIHIQARKGAAAPAKRLVDKNYSNKIKLFRLSEASISTTPFPAVT